MRINIGGLSFDLDQSNGTSEWISPLLAQGTYTVTILHTSGGSVNIDSIIIPSNSTTTPTVTLTPIPPTATILSGDIGITGNNSDNSYHVVVGSNTDVTAILDGFTISWGNANGSDLASQGQGGGIYNFKGNPTLTTLIIKENAATFGGGMFNGGNYNDSSSGSSPTLTDVTFSSNSATNGGGGMRNENHSNPALTDVTFKNNSVARTGGGMENFNFSSPIITDATFDGNTAGAGGVKLS